jgi:Ferritin-like domain
MSDNNLIDDLIAQAPNRRSFVRNLGIASALVGAVAGTKGHAQNAPAIGDADILNFALNLEYLEAEFYTVATTGKPLATGGVNSTGAGTPGLTSGGNLVSFSDPRVQAVAMELAADEQAHVKLLQGAIAGIGGTAVSKPAINLAALGIGFATQNDFLAVARVFEDIGVTAYGGAAPLIMNKAILGYAARILAVEAEHVGNIRLLVSMNAVATTAIDGVDHLPPPTGTLYFSTNSSALTEVRTPGQVLFLAYGGKANVTSGGFFPNGVNGLLNTSSAAETAGGGILTASPNPIPVSLANGATTGSTTITYNAPVSSVQLRLNSPSGPVVQNGSGSGTYNTGNLPSGTVFYLQDSSQGNSQSAANTLATLTITLAPM